MSSRSVALFCLSLSLLQVPVLPRAQAQPSCSTAPGSLPEPSLPAGVPNAQVPLEHLIIVMQENRSFDTYFGALDQREYPGAVDGLSQVPASAGLFHQGPVCTPDTAHEWDDMHRAWNGGANDGFRRVNGRNALGYYDRRELNFYYALADQFAIGDRYFSSVLGPTYPNRLFFYGATSLGNEGDHFLSWRQSRRFRTIFDLLTEYGIPWRYYFTDLPVLGIAPNVLVRHRHHVSPISRFYRDLHNDRLPAIVVIDNSTNYGDEHPPSNIQRGQEATASLVTALLKSPAWKRSAFLLTYDEAGGLYDHVPPPQTCAPDSVDSPDFTQLGFRVPFLVVSPFARRHFVSHRTYEHASLLKLIETRFNLPALTRRDANAEAPLELFDFTHPDFTVPTLPEPLLNDDQAWDCAPFPPGTSPRTP